LVAAPAQAAERAEPKESAPLKLLRLEPVASLAKADDTIDIQ
jgi:hypothetical protein